MVVWFGLFLLFVHDQGVQFDPFFLILLFSPAAVQGPPLYLSRRMIWTVCNDNLMSIELKPRCNLRRIKIIVERVIN